MKEYIEREAARDLMEQALVDEWEIQYADDRLDEIPAVDAVPVVRCKECKWYQESNLLAPNKFCFRLKGKDGEKVGYNFADDDFCSHGERKGGTNDDYLDGRLFRLL